MLDPYDRYTVVEAFYNYVPFVVLIKQAFSTKFQYIVPLQILKVVSKLAVIYQYKKENKCL